MTILLTLERYIAVGWPLISRRILTIEKGIACTLSVIGFAIFLNIPRWREAQRNIVEGTGEPPYNFYPSDYGIVEPQRWKLTRMAADTDLLLHTDYRTIYHGWIWLVLMYGIPIPLLTAINARIWIHVSVSRGRSTVISFIIVKTYSYIS